MKKTQKLGRGERLPANQKDQARAGAGSRLPAKLVAAPSGRYLEMTDARYRAGLRATELLKVPIWLDVPGTSRGGHTVQAAFKMMVMQPFFHEQCVRAALMEQAGSLWEVVEFEELLCLGQLAAENDLPLPADLTSAFRIHMRGGLGLNQELRNSVAGLVTFASYTLHYHAGTISRCVIPKLAVNDASLIAEALVISEAFVHRLSGTKTNLVAGQFSALETQACELAALLWIDWPRDVDFSEMLNPPPRPPTYEERALAAGLTQRKAEVAS